MLLNTYFTPPGFMATRSVSVVPDTQGSYICHPPERRQDPYAFFVAGPHPSPHSVYSTHTGSEPTSSVTETEAPRLPVPSHTQTIPIPKDESLPPPPSLSPSLRSVPTPHDPSCSPSTPTPDGPPVYNYAAMLPDVVMKRRTHDCDDAAAAAADSILALEAETTRDDAQQRPRETTRREGRRPRPDYLNYLRMIMASIREISRNTENNDDGVHPRVLKAFIKSKWNYVKDLHFWKYVDKAISR